MSPDQPPRRSTYHHGNLRSSLLNVSTELARHGGPESIVLREAARLCGVSPTAAYRHFATLEDLREAVAKNALAEMARTMEASLAAAKVTNGSAAGTAKERLRAVGRGYLDFGLREPGLYETIFSVPLPLDHHNGVGDLGMTPIELLRVALDALVETGILPASRREDAVAVAWSCVHGLSMLLLGPLSTIPNAKRPGIIELTVDAVVTGLTDVEWTAVKSQPGIVVKDRATKELPSRPGPA